MKTQSDEETSKEQAASESGIEYRATIRFPQKDYEFMQRLIKDGEYTNVTEIVREAVKRFRLEWRDGEAFRNYAPFGPWMEFGPPWMRGTRRRVYESRNGTPDDREDR